MFSPAFAVVASWRWVSSKKWPVGVQVCQFCVGVCRWWSIYLHQRGWQTTPGRSERFSGAYHYRWACVKQALNICTNKTHHLPILHGCSSQSSVEQRKRIAWSSFMGWEPSNSLVCDPHREATPPFLFLRVNPCPLAGRSEINTKGSPFSMSQFSR